MPFIIAPLAVLTAAFFTVFYFFKKKGLRFDSEVSGRLKLLSLAFLGVAVWFIVFEDRDMIFECSADKTVCNYFHSTIADTNMRFVRSYDISDLRDVRTQKQTSYRGRGRRKTFYRIVFETPEETFDFPKNFDFREEAEQETARLRAYLFSERPAYRYIEQKAGSDTVFLVLMGGMFLLIFGMILTVLMGIQLYKAR